jgi:hypothetical protein
MGAAPERLTAMARRISEKVRRFAMGLFNKKEELPGSALRFLSAAFPAADDKKPALPRPGHLPVLDKIGAKAILKDIDWDAPEAKDFLAAASIDAADLPSFKIGDRPDILAGAFKDPIRIELFERLLCCSCCCGSYRICKWYPFCRRRCGRVLFELKDGSTYWAYRVRVIGADVEKDLAHPGGVKITVAASGGCVSQTDFDDHIDSGDHDARYALLSHTHSGYALDTHTHSGYAPLTHAHTGYAADTHTHLEFADKIHAHTDYADKTHAHTEFADKVHVHTGYAGTPHDESAHSVSFITANANACLTNPASSGDTVSVTIDLPSGMIPIPSSIVSATSCIKASWCPTSGGVGSVLTPDSVSISGSGATRAVSFKLNAGTTAAPDYYDRSISKWNTRTVIVFIAIPLIPD